MPCAPMAQATAAPMPVLAPVTSATRPRRSGNARPEREVVFVMGSLGMSVSCRGGTNVRRLGVSETVERLRVASQDPLRGGGIGRPIEQQFQQGGVVRRGPLVQVRPVAGPEAAFGVRGGEHA